MARRSSDGRLDRDVDDMVIGTIDYIMYCATSSMFVVDQAPVGKPSHAKVR